MRSQRGLNGLYAVAKAVCVMSLLLVLTTMIAYVAQAGPLPQSAAEGDTLFHQKCVGCHTIGGGTLVGPDLKGVTTIRSVQWLTSWISAPDKMIAEKDPIALQLLQQYNNLPMPNLGLTPTQVASLIAYLQTQSGTAPAQPTAPGQPATPPQPTTALPAGNAAAGKDLFTGVTRFQSGGPPCMGCHSIAGVGALGGGALGPDLTGAYKKYGGDAGLASFLTSLPVPTMNAVWTAHPMTPQEQANVRAFLAQASAAAAASTNAIIQLAVLAVVGLAVLLVLAQLYWHRRLTAVRRPMVRNAALTARAKR